MSAACPSAPSSDQPSDLTPQGKRKRGRPRETWRRTVEKDLNTRGLSLDMAPAADRARWRTLAVASRVGRHREDK